MKRVAKLSSFVAESRSVEHRCGTFTTIVLVCLLISTMLLGSLLKIALLQDRQIGRESFRVQAMWLAEAGLDRAALHLQDDPAFASEIWQIGSERIAGRDSAVVTIRIEKVEANTLQRLIVAQAAYPATGADQARVTRQAIVTLAKEP